MKKCIKSAFISVYHKDGLGVIVRELHALGVTICSTGGTGDFISELGIPITKVETLTDYPSILGGRVKTLHPKVLGGILVRRDNVSDKQDMIEYEIPPIDLVIVDLYPFKQTVASGANHVDIIEKIDIGGITLIRAAAKNYNDVTIVSHQGQYSRLLDILETQGTEITEQQRYDFAVEAFGVTSHYDTAIHSYFNNADVFNLTVGPAKELRYGENPHQKGTCYGDLGIMFQKLHGKEISTNNLGDIDAAVGLMNDIKEGIAFAIIKHANSCGFAIRPTLIEAWKDALAGDSESAFGGIFITNTKMDKVTADEINKIFYEVVIAPEYEDEALEILMSKKDRIILAMEKQTPALQQIKYLPNLHVMIVQDTDINIETVDDLKMVTNVLPTAEQITDLLLANVIVKHLKSNGIALVKNGQVISIGTGQTSRVDALEQAIKKAKKFGFDITGAVMASEAFFPFPDCVQIAHEAGIAAVIQPGGSIKDQLSIDYCNEVGMAMVLTGVRHFKH